MKIPEWSKSKNNNQTYIIKEKTKGPCPIETQIDDKTFKATIDIGATFNYTSKQVVK